MKQKFTKQQLAKWAKYNLKPVYLPALTIDEKFDEKEYIKPNEWFYNKIRVGKIAKDSDILKEGWYLADFTKGADYTNGTQVFKKDPLSPIITKLREEGKVGKHDNTPLGSRFSITYDEWASQVLPALSSELGIKFRLERAIEFNYIGNKFDNNRGKFNCWEWFEDCFEDSSRLFGGGRVNGGLAYADYYWCDRRDSLVAARPLGVLELGTGDLETYSLNERVKELESDMAKIRKIINL